MAKPLCKPTNATIRSCLAPWYSARFETWRHRVRAPETADFRKSFLGKDTKEFSPRNGENPKNT